LGFAPTTWNIAQLNIITVKNYDFLGKKKIDPPKLSIESFNPKQHKKPRSGNYTGRGDEKGLDLVPKCTWAVAILEASEPRVGSSKIATHHVAEFQ